METLQINKSREKDTFESATKASKDQNLIYFFGFACAIVALIQVSICCSFCLA
jgi:hypothetical protein